MCIAGNSNSIGYDECEDSIVATQKKEEDEKYDKYFMSIFAFILFFGNRKANTSTLSYMADNG